MDRARQLAITGMVVSGILGISKIAAGIAGHSAAVTADGFESTADVITSGMVLVGLILAARPADENHPYGHGRVETLTGLLLGFLLVCVGCAIAWHGFTQSADEAQPPALFAIVPLAISIGAKLVMGTLKYRHGRRIGSSSLVADAANDGVDMLSGGVALAGVGAAVLDPMRFLQADHYAAAAVGIIVIAAGSRVIYESGMHLIDTMPDESSMSRIREVALSVRDVAGVEKCYARKTGMKYHVDLHLEVDPEMTVRASHEVARRVRDHIRDELPWVADVLVHVEPSAS